MPTAVHDLATPALVVDATALEHNLATMAAALPGSRLRPHVKAHKCTALAHQQREHGHAHFCAATPREVIGMAFSGLGADLLLANECVDSERLRALAKLDARVTIAVDSAETIVAAAAAGLREVLIDVNVGLPRCGCLPDAAGRLADDARAAGLTVRGVMGYEGHVVGLESAPSRTDECARSMEKLAAAHALVGGDIVSAGGTGTYAINDVATEIQAGSYALMDTAYAKLGLPFSAALHVAATVVHVNSRYAVADCGLKALGMDHGNPSIADAEVRFCSDEHVTFVPHDVKLRVGDRVLVAPAHVDPTIAYHERLCVVDGPGLGAVVIDEWAIDLRGW